jgi:hypothetical protein
MMCVIIRRIMKEGNAVVVIGNELRKGVMEFQRRIPGILEPSKAAHRTIINTYARPHY